MIKAESVAAFSFCYDGLNFKALMKCKFFPSSLACPHECDDTKTRSRRTGPRENIGHRQELNASAVPISHDRALFNS